MRELPGYLSGRAGYRPSGSPVMGGSLTLSLMDGWITSQLERETFNKFVTTRTPLGYWGVPEDLQGAVIFLASRTDSLQQ